MIIAIISCILYVAGIVESVYDDTFREIAWCSFTSVGFPGHSRNGLKKEERT